MLTDPSNLQGDLRIAEKGGMRARLDKTVKGMKWLKVLAEQNGIVNAWLWLTQSDLHIRLPASLHPSPLPKQISDDALRSVTDSGKVFTFTDHTDLISGGLFPLIKGREVLGVIGITSDQTDYFKLETLRWVKTLCGIISDDLFADIDNGKISEAEHAISKILLSSLDIRDGLPIVLTTLSEVLHADAIIVLQYNSLPRRFGLLMTHGLNSGALAKINFHLDVGMASRSLERKMIWIEDLCDPAWNMASISPLKEEGFRSYLALPLTKNGNLTGALEVAWRAPHISVSWDVVFLERVAEQIAFVIDRTNVLNNYRELNADLTVQYNAMIEGLSRALELRDLETVGHTRRVSRMTLRLAEHMGIPSDQWDAIRQGALLHDIGKIGIPDAILLKPGSLTLREREVMQQHVTYGYNILAPITSLRPVLDIALYHHEHWDGSGYPYGLKGEQIPLVARIFTFIDVYDALTSDRPYRTAWSPSQALEYIREQSGNWFDPHISQFFIDIAGEGI